MWWQYLLFWVPYSHLSMSAPKGPFVHSYCLLALCSSCTFHSASCYEHPSTFGDILAYLSLYHFKINVFRAPTGSNLSICNEIGRTYTHYARTQQPMISLSCHHVSQTFVSRLTLTLIVVACMVAIRYSNISLLSTGSISNYLQSRQHTSHYEYRYSV